MPHRKRRHWYDYSDTNHIHPVFGEVIGGWYLILAVCFVSSADNRLSILDGAQKAAARSRSGYCARSIGMLSV